MKNFKVLVFTKLFLTVLYVIGYVMCIVKLCQCDFDGNKSSWKAEVVYGIGTFTGLGGIIGWLDMGE